MEIINKIEESNKYVTKFSIFIVFLLIYYNNESFPSIILKSPIPSILLLLLVFGGFFLYKVISKNRKINLEASILVIILIASLLITMITTQDYSGGFLKIMIGLIIGYMLSHFLSIYQFTASYVRVMLFIAIYSLCVTYVLRPIVFGLPSVVAPIFTNDAGFSFINLHFSMVLNEPYYFRNFGIFREPGVYQFFINIALIFELFFKRGRINGVTILIFCITSISTFSTVAFISTFVILFSSILVSNRTSKAFNKLNRKIIASTLLILLFSILIVLVTSENFSAMMTSTMEKLTQRESSFQGRIVAVLANLSFWIENPFFGHGIEALGSSVRGHMLSKFNFSTAHNTSTTGAMLVSFGIVFTFFTVYGLFRFLEASKVNKIVIIMMFLVVMFCINTQLFIYNEVLYTLILYGYQGVKLKRVR